jgi:methyl-accepting chemotaxis protein
MPNNRVEGKMNNSNMSLRRRLIVITLIVMSALLALCAIALFAERTHHAVASMTEGESQASQGVALAAQAGESIGHIRDSAQRVTTVVTAINDAIREQTAATSEISTRVDRIAQMTEDGADEVNRTAAAARELQEMSQTLHQSVGRFQLS